MPGGSLRGAVASAWRGTPALRHPHRALAAREQTHAIARARRPGYFCVDNLPTLLIPPLAEAGAAATIPASKKIAPRRWTSASATSCGSSQRVYERLQAGPGVSADADLSRGQPFVAGAALQARSRRPHPMAPDRSCGGIREGASAKLGPIRAMADMIVDTSELTVHELRDIFMKMSRDGRGRAELVVTLLSFGFSTGSEDADRLRRALSAQPALRGPATAARTGPGRRGGALHAAPREHGSSSSGSHRS